MPSIAGIAAALGPLAARFDVDVLDECDSTNSQLLDRAEAGAPSGSVLVARHQTAGRGRRGRTWHSAPGDSLTFSLLWRFPATCPMGGLSLAAGVAVARALEAADVAGIRLKWPNDLLRDGRKLGGILVELVPNSRWTAVIGIGLNRRLPEAMPPEVAELAATLGPDPAADELLAHLLTHLLTTFEAFAPAGFPAVREAWLARNAHAGAMVRVLSDFEPPLEGRFVDVDEEGALRVSASGQVRRLISGEVSLRPILGDGS
ncbi:MAG: biotin--[acetyl-CoA-carboxylase] ligase [Rhodocyclaceae bacterium]|nr:biotin--[acetyl-CoA-carboxylase] ligase [Rhodocyclaceae bacterium]